MIDDIEGQEDLIAAIGTTVGEAAIGIVRMSGKGASDLIPIIFKPSNQTVDPSKIESHRLYLGEIIDQQNRPVDQVLLVLMKAPKSYTREDVVEIYCHGGVLAVKAVLELVLQRGARLAEPGEFTKRAFLNGRIDLAQAEAVLDLIRSRSRRGVDGALRQLEGSLSERIKELRNDLKKIITRIEASLDFPEEIDQIDYNVLDSELERIGDRIKKALQAGEVGRIYQEGLPTVLLGKPNTGKSTLLNRLLGLERALVTDIPGTTRDIIEETIIIEGIPLRVIDTAGIREKTDLVESLGIERAKKAVEEAELVLILLDAVSGVTDDDRSVFKLAGDKSKIIIINKIDLVDRLPEDLQRIKDEGEDYIIEISAKKGRGIELLKKAVVEMVGTERINYESLMVSNRRQRQVLERVLKRLEEAINCVRSGLTDDCVQIDLWEAWQTLGEITGESVTDEIIDSIFSEFCVGK